jgi:hypothetical protein
MHPHCQRCSCVCDVLQVLGRMKQAMVEHSSSASHSFLLDDDSTLPFVANDILAQMDDKVRVTQLLHVCTVHCVADVTSITAKVAALWCNCKHVCTDRPILLR